MGNKKFQSDRRFERKRHRHQFDVVVKGASSREFDTPYNRREMLSRQREADFERLVAKQREAFSAQRMEAAAALGIERFESAARSLREGLELVLLGGYRRTAQMDMSSLEAAAIHYSLGTNKTDMKAAMVDDADFSTLRNVDELLSCNRELRCAIYPRNILGSLGEEHAVQLDALRRAAEAGGIVFSDDGAFDFTLSFSGYLWHGCINMQTFLVLCARRTSSDFVVSRSMAASAVGHIKRNTRLED
ncbi:hypothetical protein EVC24_045 [Rhizobium phage RHph_I4]|nr:hypothetical protein EVC24_045 [Rhizobium phage RHph_I4]